MPTKVFLSSGYKRPDNLFEGDIMLDDNDKYGNPGNDYNAKIDAHWPDGIVPYVITGKFTDREMDIIQRGFKEFNDRTCVKFVERTQNQTHYLNITNSKEGGCTSFIGMSPHTNESGQILNLNTDEKCVFPLT